MLSSVALMELQCAETYYRTVILCEELTISQQLWQQIQQQLPLHCGNREEIMQRGHVTTDGTCNLCCSIREMQSGVCKHADEALQLVRRRNEFQATHSVMQQRVKISTDRLRDLYTSVDVS